MKPPDRIYAGVDDDQDEWGVWHKANDGTVEYIRADLCIPSTKETSDETA